MNLKNKDNIFFLLSGVIFLQLILELIILKQINNNNILRIINYFNLISLSLITLFITFFVKNNYSGKSHHENMEKFYNIIKKSSINYYFQQLFHNSIFTIILTIILSVINGIGGGISFISGYGISSILGFIGVKIANYINIRMANMAIVKDKRSTENTGFIGGLIMGISLLLPIAAVSLCPFIIRNNLMFCFGAGIAAILTRLTGGFFTKSADIAADMVGKLDYGLPEDDLRNPAVLADNIGDIVGDCIGSIQSFFAISCFILKIMPVQYFFSFYQLSFIISIFIMSMIISSGLFFVTCNKRSINQRIILFFSGNIIILMASMFFYKTIFPLNFKTFILGIITVIINGLTVYFFTSPINYSWGNFNFPIKDLAKSSQLGAGINVLKGIALGKLCTMIILLEMIVINIINFWLTDFVWFGLEFALGVLSLSPFIMLIDNFGPLADNSGGLVESITQEEISQPARIITDQLDQFGNTTKAITKVLNYILLIAVFTPCLLEKNITLTFLNVLSSLLGSILIIAFTGISINIVLSITCNITNLVKNIFEDNPKILTGEQEPDYKDLIGQLTDEVLNKAHIPFYLTLLINIIFILIIFGIFKQSSTTNLANWTMATRDLLESFSPSTMVLLEMSMTITGIIFGMYMSITGGAWDNCKKLIETGIYGGKKSPTHTNAVIGDLVGDIFKDTTGPAIAPLILVIYCFTELTANFIEKFYFI
jgi:K(+)-stimulated pyrophosphate-energized sodium pump